MKNLVIILLGILFFACHTDKLNKETFVFKENLEFRSGFKTGIAQIETFGGEEYICFSDYLTHKEIVLHNLYRDENYHIDLSNVTGTGEKISGVEILNLDTIMILSAYTNKLFMINRDGVIWNKIDFNPYLEKEGKYELLSSDTPFQYNDTSLIFSLSYVSGPPAQEKPFYYTTFYQEKYAAPKLFKVDNIFKDSLNTHFGLCNLYNNFTNENYRAIEGSGFIFLDDQIIFKSAYCDTIYQIDPNLLTITKRTKITSAFGRIYLDPVSIEESMMDRNAINDNFSSHGQIRSVHYNPIKALFYVIVGHKPIEKTQYEWSIIVLDNSFNQKMEIQMDDSKYSQLGLLSSKGLLISNYKETLGDTNHFYINTYALFNYE